MTRMNGHIPKKKNETHAPDPALLGPMALNHGPAHQQPASCMEMLLTQQGNRKTAATSRASSAGDTCRKLDTGHKFCLGSLDQAQIKKAIESC